MFKKIAIMSIAMLILFSCAADRSASPTRTANFGWTKIRDHSAGQCTTTVDLVFKIDHSNGALTLWLDPDTVDGVAGNPDSCAQMDLYLKNKESGEWGKHYLGVTKLDTIKRSIFNVPAASNDVYIPLANFNDVEWAWADSAKVTLTWGTGDIFAGIGAWVGGQ